MTANIYDTHNDIHVCVIDMIKSENEHQFFDTICKDNRIIPNNEIKFVKDMLINYGKLGIHRKIFNVTLQKYTETHYSLANELINKSDIIIIITQIDHENIDINDVTLMIERIKRVWKWEDLNKNDKIIVIVSDRNKLSEIKIDKFERLLHFTSNINDTDQKIDLDIMNNNRNNTIHKSVVYGTKMKSLCHKEGLYYLEISLQHEKYLAIQDPSYKSKPTTILDTAIKNFGKTLAVNPNESTNNYGDLLYDISMILLSWSDFITDVIMLFVYYKNGWIVYFILSLIVISIAQIVSVGLFMVNYSYTNSNPNDKSWYCKSRQRRCLILKYLLVAPFINTIIYFGAKKKHSYISKILLHKMELYNHCLYRDTEVNYPWPWEWFDNNTFQKHMGFLIEGIVKSIPSLLIQIICIINYSDSSAIAVISIMISLISFSTKSYIFGASIDTKVFLLNWLCIIADFVGIFFLISWLFFDVTFNWNSFNEFTSSFNIIGQIWFYQALATNIGMCVLGFTGIAISLLIVGVCLLAEFLIDSIEDANSMYNWRKKTRRIILSICSTLCLSLAGLLLLSLILAGLVIVTAIVFVVSEAFTYAHIMLLLFMATEDDVRLQRKNYYLFKNADVLLNQSKNTHDRLLRIISICKVLSTNKAITAYINKNEKLVQDKQERAFNDISFKSLSDLNDIHGYSELRLWNLFKSVFVLPLIENAKDAWNYEGNKAIPLYIGALVMIFVFYPMYILSRIFKIVFPIIVTIYLIMLLIVDDSRNNITGFQLSIYGLYMSIYIPLLSLMYPVLKLHHSRWYVSHYCYFTNHLSISESRILSKKMKRYYNRCTYIPITRAIIIDFFGNDIGTLICQYIAWF